MPSENAAYLSTAARNENAHAAIIALKTDRIQIYIDLVQKESSTGSMFKKEPPTSKGEQTRAAIFETALELFRDRGFDSTTMQDIAAAAAVAKSAAYYYFPSKEAIVTAYYDAVQTEQERLCAQTFAETRNLRRRLDAALMTKFDLARDDRKLLGIIFRYAGEPAHPLSCLGERTSDIRHRSMRSFSDALAVERLPNDLEQLLPLALWALQMGLLVLFLYDSTKGQQRTRRLAAGALDLTEKLLKLAKLPLLKPIRTRLLKLLDEAGLLPPFNEIAAR
jgi:AcrR family transcriptional regulator